MKLQFGIYLRISSIAFLICCFFLTNKGQANPRVSPSHIDFLPRYRTNINSLMISKIDYFKDSLVFHCRYVVNENKVLLNFMGAEVEGKFKVSYLQPLKANKVKSMSNVGFVRNVRINDEIKHRFLDAESSVDIAGTAGDMVSWEVVAYRPGKKVRTIHFEGGRVKGTTLRNIKCKHIILKHDRNPMLGTKKTMESNVRQFYQKQKVVRYPDILEVTSSKQLKKFDSNLATRKVKANPIQRSLEPIDYMPKVLSSVKDITCNERIILKNVYFHENRADYSGRLKAMRTLNILVQYMKYSPRVKVILHGHTDVMGNAFRNLELSKQRVLLVKRSLVTKGIESSRIITVHHGGAQPLPRYKDGGSINRRVEIQLICK
jgi:outer membrane protein OmpA-like peptidoglycan-associated protein